jgi:hypothetical protein
MRVHASSSEISAYPIQRGSEVAHLCAGSIFECRSERSDTFVNPLLFTFF